MSLLTIAHGVADECKGARPASIAGNTDPDAQQYLRLINKVGTRLMRIYDWQELRKERTFTSIAGEEQTGAIPDDFDRFIPETFWDRSSNNLLSGPITPVEWNGLKVQSFTSENKKFIYRGGSVFTQPTLGTGVDMAFEYVSDEWATDTTGATGKTSMTVDTDLSLIDDELMIAITKYEWLKDEGQPYQEAARDAKDALDMLVKNDRPTDNIAVAGDIFTQNTRHFDGTPKASRIYYGNDF